MIEALVALIVATAALLGSPGPATLSLAAVGATTGFQRGLPYLFGILAGLLFVMAGAIAGLATVLTRWPGAATVVQIAGAAWILYVAWKIAFAPVDPDTDNANRRLPGIRDGFILNILNPKAYAAFLALFSQFLLPVDGETSAYLFSAGLSFAVAIVVDTAWLAAGGLLQTLFREPRSARVLRIVFALMIVAVTLWVIVVNMNANGQ